MFNHYINRHYSFIVIILLLSLITTACGVPRAIVPSVAANSTPALLAGIKIDPPTDIPTTAGEQTVVLAGGCFWGVEAVFERLQGVSSVVSGFSGGDANTANYDAVSNGTTKHAEAVQITYDPQKVSFGKLLKIYFMIAHDPTEVNRQGPDKGSQYRSAIFFANPQQQQVAQAYIDRLNQAQVFSQPIATQLVSLSNFYPAEEYHQNFIDRNPNYPYVVINDLPKLDQLRQQFPDLVKR
jgi:peptide-methionine (S)-S-oxide reductase